jgi:hypothetical protein
MEVWVRSQDKENFLPMRGLRYKREEYKKTKEFGDFAEETQLFCDYDIVVKHYIYSDYYVNVVGEYATRERCLEIIDEIQSLLCQNFCIIRNLDVSEDVGEYLKPTKAIVYQAQNQTPSIEYHEQSVVVYEMPKE